MWNNSMLPCRTKRERVPTYTDRQAHWHRCCWTVRLLLGHCHSQGCCVAICRVPARVDWKFVYALAISQPTSQPAAAAACVEKRCTVAKLAKEG